MEPPSLTQLSPGNCGCLASFTSTVQSFKTCWSAAVLSAHSHRLFLTLFPRRAPGGIPDGVKMSVAGFKKQFYKASQLMSEKVGGAEGTKLDEDFKDLERKADITSKAVVEVINKTSEYLQPNPATRAKLSMLNTVSKIRGQNFIDPLQAVAEKDIKDIQHHLKKLEGRRLDYDYKKKRQGKIQDEEIRQALEKFHESKELAESSMHNLLETDVEQVSQLSSFVESLLQYHREAAQIFEELSDKLRERVVDAQNRPRREYTPKPRPAYDFGELEQSNGGYSTAATSPPAYSTGKLAHILFESCVNLSEPCCKALYDFEPENEGELGFHEGDIITLVSQIDENWFEGTLRGRSGYFPNNYVEVMVPLSH
ncbi:endophilin-A2-like isoform X6 [Echeneis naucrates]|uniref:endophilin-A2-like isoform X6 n=1 Tax=Echeneis naucrates TaxID=173247 RepID=UPI0011132D86|nr:endophilin-A2-like isoform X6 [Echeneis naucrates]